MHLNTIELEFFSITITFIITFIYKTNELNYNYFAEVMIYITHYRKKNL